MTQDKRRLELIKTLGKKYFSDNYNFVTEECFLNEMKTIGELVDFILSRESELIRNHEILTKTIVDTKNAEMKALVEMVRKPLKEMSDELRDINLRLPLTRRCQEAIDEALSILDEIKKG